MKSNGEAVETIAAANLISIIILNTPIRLEKKGKNHNWKVNATFVVSSLYALPQKDSYEDDDDECLSLFSALNSEMAINEQFDRWEWRKIVTWILSIHNQSLAVRIGALCCDAK